MIAVVATHAELPPELYWKSVLPSTPMPKSIATLLFQDGKHIGTPPPRFVFHYGQPPHFLTKLQDNPNTALFLLEKNLKSGHRMNLVFKKTSSQSPFLPRQVVKSIPFSSTKMAEILNKFGVKPGSVKADVMKNTIEVCEETAIKGEDKHCATSLESMLDFITSKLGKHVEALSTQVNKNETKKQQYTITSVEEKEKVGEENPVVCHKLNYVYAVFYCHKVENTVAYTASLEGADGSRVEAVSVCHRDTSAWDPKHLAFQMLKVKPGSAPICHFLVQDSVAWVPKQN